jgi:hypothetical protein
MSETSGSKASSPKREVAPPLAPTELDRELTALEKHLRGKTRAARYLKVLGKEHVNATSFVERLFAIVLHWSKDSDWRAEVKSNRNLLLRTAARLEEGWKLYKRSVLDPRCNPGFWVSVVHPDDWDEVIENGLPGDAEFDQALAMRIAEMRRRATFLGSMLRPAFAQYKNQVILELLDYVYEQTGKRHYSEIAALIKDGFDFAPESNLLPPLAKGLQRSFTAEGLKKLHQRRRF